MWYEYTCPNGHVTEKRGGVADATSPCPRCDGVAERRQFNLVPILGSTVMKEQKYRVSEFMEASQEINYGYAKAENEGMPVKRPDLWGQAKAKARKQGAKLR